MALIENDGTVVARPRRPVSAKEKRANHLSYIKLRTPLRRMSTKGSLIIQSLSRTLGVKTLKLVNQRRLIPKKRGGAGFFTYYCISHYSMYCICNLNDRTLVLLGESSSSLNNFRPARLKTTINSLPGQSLVWIPHPLPLDYRRST